MSTDVAVGVIGAIALIVTALVTWASTRSNGMFDKAMRMIDQLQEQLDVTGRDLADHKASDLRARRERQVAYAAHSDWDRNVWKQLNQAGIDVPSPPPLHEEG